VKEVHIVGIGTSGDISIAGPLTVCAASIPMGKWHLFREFGYTKPRRVHDYKYCSPEPIRRNDYPFPNERVDKAFKKIQEMDSGLITWSISYCDVYEIEKIGLKAAREKAIRSAVYRLCLTNNWDVLTDVEIIISGLTQLSMLPSSVPHVFVQDSRLYIMPSCIAFLIAQSCRYRIMLEAHKKYPHYDFKKNLGVATVKHLKGLVKFGPIINIHRLKPAVRAVKGYIQNSEVKTPIWLKKLQEKKIKL